MPNLVGREWELKGRQVEGAWLESWEVEGEGARVRGAQRAGEVLKSRLGHGRFIGEGLVTDLKRVDSLLLKALRCMYPAESRVGGADA